MMSERKYLGYMCGIAVAVFLFAFNLVDRQYLYYTYRSGDVVCVRKTAWQSLQVHNVTRKVLPHCIIAGVAKCGTRALLDFLALHSDISAAPRESAYFNALYTRGQEWYRNTMSPSYPHQLTMEKTPNYFSEGKAPERIQHMNKTIKLIFSVREPVTRMISHYVELGLHKTDAWRAERDPFEKEAFNKTGQVTNSVIALASKYDVHMVRWMKYFNRSQIHVVDGEELIRNPGPELIKIETFLGIEHQITPEMFYFNEEKGFYCVKQKNSTGCLSNEKGMPHPEVRQDVVKKLCKYFEPHNKAFYKLVGQDFHWKCPLGTN